MKINLKSVVPIVVVGLFLAISSGAVLAQGEKARPSLTGKYQGTAKSDNREMTMTIDLVDANDTFSGSVVTPYGTFKIVEGKLADNLLTLKTEGNGTNGEFSLRVKDDQLAGQLKAKGGVGTVELHKLPVDEISGEWDAVADAQGQPFPFTLNLKLDGEKVTGTSDSQLGHSTVSSGVWKDGKLALILDSATGPVGLMATLTDGKLVGDYDYAGQLQGRWMAVRKQ
jgi:hypothetical protein